MIKRNKYLFWKEGRKEENQHVWGEGDGRKKYRKGKGVSPHPPEVKGMHRARQVGRIRGHHSGPAAWEQACRAPQWAEGQGPTWQGLPCPCPNSQTVPTFRNSCLLSWWRPHIHPVEFKTDVAVVVPAPEVPWMSPVPCYTRYLAAAATKSLQSWPTLCDSIDGSLPGSPVPGILQAGTLEWVAISFSNAWKWKVKVKSLSRVRLIATPWTAAYQAPLSMGFSRQEYCTGVPLPSPIPRWSHPNQVLTPTDKLGALFLFA